MENEEVKELAYKILDKYFYIQVCDDGYDYSIYSESYHLLDGGVYDNQEINIYQATTEIIADIIDNGIVPYDVQKLQEAVEIVDNGKMKITEDVI